MASPRPQLRLLPGSYLKQWAFVMISSEQQKAVLRAINHSPKPATTLRIWNAAITAVEYDTGAIAASSAELADIAEVPQAEARRALTTLADLGALLRVSRGRYRINPHVAWAGSQVGREALAAQSRPVLQLVHDADS